MPRDRRRLAEEWLEVAERDLETAGIALAGGAAAGSAAVLIQQAVEKYLKGYLIMQGWQLRKIHDLQVLIDDAADYDPSFTDFMELARILTGIYVEDRYPPGRTQTLSAEEAGEILQQAEKLIQKIKDAFSRN